MNTSGYADLMGKSGLRIKKNISRIRVYPSSKAFWDEDNELSYFIDALARILVYSMRVDGESRNLTPANDGAYPLPSGYIAGSKAVESLDRLITSIESFFHPSNTGQWTLSVGLGFYQYTDSINSFLVNLFFTAFGCRVCQTLDGRRRRILLNSSSMSLCPGLQTVKLTF